MNLVVVGVDDAVAVGVVFLLPVLCLLCCGSSCSCCNVIFLAVFGVAFAAQTLVIPNDLCKSCLKCLKSIALI